MSVKQLAKKLPYTIQQPLKYIYSVIPRRLRYGKVFWETYNFLQESQWWSREKLEEYQIQQLSRLLRHAYENVSYYRVVLDERGLKPKDIQDFKDLQQLPYLTKEDVRMNFNDLIARNIPKEQMDYGTTEVLQLLSCRCILKNHLMKLTFEKCGWWSEVNVL